MMSWDIALSWPWRTKGIVDAMNTRTLAVDTEATIYIIVYRIVVLTVPKSLLSALKASSLLCTASAISTR